VLAEHSPRFFAREFYDPLSKRARRIWPRAARCSMREIRKELRDNDQFGDVALMSASRWRR